MRRACHAPQVMLSSRWVGRTVLVAEPSGAIGAVRIVVPVGARARVSATIPGVAMVDIATPAGRGIGPSDSCRRRGRVESCTQAEEACPMPPGRWHVRLDSYRGPAGEIRFEMAFPRAGAG